MQAGEGEEERQALSLVIAQGLLVATVNPAQMAVKSETIISDCKKDEYLVMAFDLVDRS